MYLCRKDEYVQKGRRQREKLSRKREETRIEERES